ncbi:MULTISPECIES: pilus assembly protein TadG-related protein [Streptomyces]|uniref:pilus assembly protein TadG-related protein n=1 Tax=Streptomyces TaxID=1883 RepID=UPI0004C93CD9|nr:MULTISPECIES: pilus assembly protein TadG-related protein [Streptomyces]
MPGPRDRGQAFPIYVVVLTGLLFAAFAFVVIGMGGAKRSDAQGAADAAALAAARAVRDSAFEGVDLAGLSQGGWEEILSGDRLQPEGACGKAAAFASLNDAATTTCEVALPEFRVAVTTNGTVGDSVIPGTENVKANARATAVIEPRCSLKSMPTPTPSQSPATPPPSSPSPGGGGAGTLPSVGIQCKGGVVLTLDPKEPGSLSKLARKLFSVRLAD